MQKKAWEASGQSRSIEAASGIPDSGGRTGTAACDLCFGLPDAFPAKIMITERKLQAGLEAAGEELSQYAYLLDSVEQGKLDGIPGAGEAAKAFSKNAEAIAAPLYARSRALAYCDTVNVSHVSMLVPR